jgi:hypothetical protein
VAQDKYGNRSGGQVMNPSIEPYDSANKPPTPSTPPMSSSSSDAAAMQAIEALEAESNGLPEVETPTPAVAPVSTPLSTTPTPVSTPTMPVETPEVPIVPNSSPQSPPEPVIASPAGEPVADLNKSLSEEAPVPNATTNFQPFAQGKKSSSKTRIVLIVVVILIVLGAGGYFGWQYWQSQTVTPAVIQPPADSTPDETVPSVDTEASVTETATDIQTQLDGIDDSDYQDATLSDSVLYN